MNSMSEPRRWVLTADNLMLIAIGGPNVSIYEAERGIPVIEAEPVLARIKELEEEREKQNKLIAELLGKYNEQVAKKAKLCEQLEEANEIIALQARYTTHINGKLARAYLKKFNGGKI